MRTAANTRGMAVAGAGGTAAGSSNIGTITLPAGGPWNIVYGWVQAVQATLAAAENGGGDLVITAGSGDVDPNMSPCRIPAPMSGSLLGATAPVQASPLVLAPLDLVAAGKAVLTVDWDQQIAITTAQQIVGGVIFGKEPIESEPAHNYETIDGTIAAAALTALGTITIPETSNKIVSVTALIAQDGVLTAGEELLGFITLASDDQLIEPLQLPFSMAFSAGLGATIGNALMCAPVFIPVDIPIVGGARINVSIDLNTAVTNAAGAKVTLGLRRS